MHEVGPSPSPGITARSPISAVVPPSLPAQRNHRGDMALAADPPPTHISGEDGGVVSISVPVQLRAGGQEGKGCAFAGEGHGGQVLSACQGGDGGNGCISLRRCRSDRQGGSGGKDGDVILECSRSIWDFSNLQRHMALQLVWYHARSIQPSAFQENLMKNKLQNLQEIPVLRSMKVTTWEKETLTIDGISKQATRLASGTGPQQIYNLNSLSDDFQTPTGIPGVEGARKSIGKWCKGMTAPGSLGANANKSNLIAVGDWGPLNFGGPVA